MTSLVSRLFSGKGREKSSNEVSDTDKQHVSKPASSKSSKLKAQDEVKTRKRKSPLFASLTSRARPLSCIVSQPESPVAARKLLANGGKDSPSDKAQRKARNERNQRPVSCIIEAVRDGNEVAKENEQKQSSKTGKSRRPVSCIVENGDLQNFAREKTAGKTKTAAKEKNTPSVKAESKQSEKPAKEHGDQNPSKAKASRGSRPAKAQRPVSCIVECPCDMTAEHQHTHTNEDRSEPKHKSTPRSTPRYVKNKKRPVSCSVDNLQQDALRFDRISLPRPKDLLGWGRSFGLGSESLSKSFGFGTESDQELLLEFMPGSPNLTQTYDSRHTLAPESCQVPESCHIPENPPAYVELNTLDNPTSFQTGLPLQNTPHDNLEHTGQPSQNTPEDTQDISCPQMPPPTPKPRQNIPGVSSYDLKSFFPPAAPNRPIPRPRSVCFPPRDEDGSVRPPPPYTPRPQSVCLSCLAEENALLPAYFQEEGEAGYAVPYSGPVQRPNSVIDLGSRSLMERRNSDGYEMIGPPTAPVRRPPSPRPAMAVPYHRFSQFKSSPRSSMGMASPRSIADLRTTGLENTLGSMATGNSSLRSESSEVKSSPSPRPRASRLAAKYRSADCLDEIEEGVLDLSPPPARPIAHFMGPHPRACRQRTEDVFTSVEMLERVGQPRARVKSPRPLSCFAGSSADESGYCSSGTPTGWLGGLSVSTGDILEALERDDLGCADDELSFEKCSSLKKAWSVSSLLRNDSIQDRSMTVMRKRRQKMKNRRQPAPNHRSSSTETDEGVEDMRTANSLSSLVDDDVVTSSEKAEGKLGALAKLEEKLLMKPRSRHPVTRLHSVHMKAWEIRLRRKQMLRRRCGKESSRLETLV